jgi:hypothetical protein
MTTPLLPPEPTQEELLKSIAVGMKRTMEYTSSIKKWVAFFGWMFIISVILSMFGCFIAVAVP